MSAPGSNDDLATRDDRGSAPANADADATPERGTAIGRYFIVDAIGAGGMGQVFAAYDPELDRKVALKLLRIRARGPSDGRARDRLLREAQAMGKLAHPNVVTVFDAGTHADHVFIAMEHVDGITLKRWLEEPSRTWQEIVDMLRATGRGLAAAHAVGLVHRDFKPANVMIGEDGRPRVLDFGLARRFDGSAASEEAADPELLSVSRSLERSGPSIDVALTETGMVMGTPAFMAPEQFFAGSIDARTDQFAFCVVLFRGLYGIPPFEGEDYRALAKAVSKGQLVTPPRDRAKKVPRAIRQAIERGLSVSKDSRFPDMNALLAVLDRARAARRRRVLQGATVAVVGGGLALAAAWSPAQRTDPCETARTAIETAWNPGRREAVQSAFEALASAAADETKERVLPSLDAYARGWTDARVDACEASLVRHDQSEHLMDLRIACLDRRRRDLAALVDVFTTADATVVDQAIGAVQQLPSLSWCSDTDALLADVPPPEDPEVAAEVARLEEALAPVRALFLAGRFEEGLGKAEALLPRAREAGHAPTLAEIHRTIGMLDLRVGRAEQAKEHLDEALWAAIESGHLREQAWTLSELTAFEAVHRTDQGNALRHARHAQAVLARLGEAPRLAAALALHTASVHMRRRDWDEAESGYREAIRIAADHPSAQPIKVSARANLIMILALRGQYDQAREEGEGALKVAIEQLGEHHDTATKIANNLATMEIEAGHAQEAIVRLSHLIEVLEEARGVDHPTIAPLFSNLAMAYERIEDWKAALAAGEHALRIKRTTLSADDRSVALTLHNMGETLLHLGRIEEARARFEEALESFGDAPEHVYVLTGLAKVQRAAGELERARASADRVLAVLDDVPLNDHDRGVIEFELAQVLWEAGGDRARARALADRARATMQGKQGDTAQPLAEIDAWLAAHPEPT